MPRLNVRWAAGILTSLALAACGGADQFGDHVDCGATGRAVTVADPADDVGAGRGDLVKASLARGGGRCATLSTREDVKAPTAFALTLTPDGAPPAQVEVTLLGGVDARVRVRTAEVVRDVPADVGGKGPEISFRLAAPVQGPFRWQAQAVAPGERRDTAPSERAP